MSLLDWLAKQERKIGTGFAIKPGVTVRYNTVTVLMPARAICCCRAERQKFLTEEWPRVRATIQWLGLTAQELQDAAASGGNASYCEEKR